MYITCMALCASPRRLHARGLCVWVREQREQVRNQWQGGARGRPRQLYPKGAPPRGVHAHPTPGVRGADRAAAWSSPLHGGHSRSGQREPTAPATACQRSRAGLAGAMPQGVGQGCPLEAHGAHSVCRRARPGRHAACAAPNGSISQAALLPDGPAWPFNIKIYIISMLQGFQYMELEANLNEEGTDVYGEWGGEGTQSGRTLRPPACLLRQHRRCERGAGLSNVRVHPGLGGWRASRASSLQAPACAPGARRNQACAAFRLPACPPGCRCSLLLHEACKPTFRPLPALLPCSGEYTPLTARDILVKDIEELKVGPGAKRKGVGQQAALFNLRRHRCRSWCNLDACSAPRVVCLPACLRRAANLPCCCWRLPLPGDCAGDEGGGAGRAARLFGGR